MEFNFDVGQFLSERITKVKFNCKFHFNNTAASYNRNYGSGTDYPSLSSIIDRMGQASSKAQGLGHVITTFGKLQACPEQSLYIMRSQESASAVVGIMKVGPKNLFVMDMEGRQHEAKCLCVLDFYVHESMQRRGFGRELFDYVLKDLNVSPVKLAIDRPSEKFLNFLAKYYNMRALIPQANNFAVFHGFFNSRPHSGGGSGLNRRRTTQPHNMRTDYKACSSIPSSSAGGPPSLPQSSASGHGRQGSGNYSRVGNHSEELSQSKHRQQFTWKPSSADRTTSRGPTTKLPTVSQSQMQLGAPVTYSGVTVDNMNSSYNHAAPSEAIIANSLNTQINSTSPQNDFVTNKFSGYYNSIEQQQQQSHVLMAPKEYRNISSMTANYTNTTNVPFSSQLAPQSLDSNTPTVSLAHYEYKRSGSDASRGKKHFPAHSRNTAPSSFNIFGTMPLSNNSYHQPANAYPGTGIPSNSSFQSNTRTAFRTRLW